METTKYKPNKKNYVRKTTHRTSFQIAVYFTIVFCTVFSLLSLFITLISAMKSNDEIIRDVFALPNATTMFGAIAHNFSIAWDTVKGMFLRSILISIAGAALDCIFGAVLAYIFSFKNIYFKKILFTLFISVMLLPSIMGMPILVPFMTNNLHLDNTFIGYLLPMLAGGQVTALFLFNTFFGQQPKALYENAQVEGANDFYIFLKITLPLAFPIIMYKFVGTFSSLYNDYLWANLILGQDKLTLIASMKTLETSAELVNELGVRYAIYAISSIPLVVTSIISMKYFASGEFASGMKL